MIFYYPDRVSSETDTDCRENVTKQKFYARRRCETERGERTASRMALPHRFATGEGERARTHARENQEPSQVAERNA